MNDSIDPDTKPTTSARMYDYYLGGRHHFPADREAAEKILALFPDVPAAARSNRAFLRRAVRSLAGLGVRQFLDIGSGIPTAGNTHEIAQEVDPQTRVVYVDLDPVAVAESLEILDGNPNATALCGDLREPAKILGHRRVSGLLDLREPVAVLLVGVLHFVPDDASAYGAVGQVMEAVAAGSYLALSHGALESVVSNSDEVNLAYEIYKQRTATAGRVRSRPEVEKFFAGMEMLEPGLVWLPQWRPDPDEPDPLIADPVRSKVWVGVARKPAS